MRYFAAFYGRGMNFNGSHPSRLSQSRWDNRFVPCIERNGWDSPVRRLDDQIRRTERVCKIPLGLVGPLFGLRHVFRIAFLSAVIHPFHDRGNLRIGERSIILELLNAHSLIDVPW